MLIWKYAAKIITVKEEKAARVLTLERGEDGGIFFTDNGDMFEINPEDVAYVAFIEPKLFSSGLISFYGENDELLTYIVDGREITCGLFVDRKQKDDFYLIFGALEQNGFTTKVLG